MPIIKVQEDIVGIEFSDWLAYLDESLGAGKGIFSGFPQADPSPVSGGH